MTVQGEVEYKAEEAGINQDEFKQRLTQTIDEMGDLVRGLVEQAMKVASVKAKEESSEILRQARQKAETVANNAMEGGRRKGEEELTVVAAYMKRRAEWEADEIISEVKKRVEQIT